MKVLIEHKYNSEYTEDGCSIGGCYLVSDDFDVQESRQSFYEHLRIAKPHFFRKSGILNIRYLNEADLLWIQSLVSTRVVTTVKFEEI